MNLALFQEYLNKGIVRKRTPDKLRAESLKEDALKRNNFLKQIINKIILNNDNANYFIEESYDILISLIRAKMLIDGYEASGNYAHEAEVSYLRNLKFIDLDIVLMNELRTFRNGIKYYGKRYNKEHAEKIIQFLDKNYSKLLNLV